MKKLSGYNSDMKDEDMTTGEAAELLGVDPSRIRQLCISKELLARKPGRDWIIRRSDLLAFQKARKERSQ